MVEIRPYTDADYEAVKRNLEEGGLFNPTIDTQETLAAKIRDRPESILVGTVGGVVVGGIYILEDHWSSFIFRLAVQRNYRKKGIGPALMNTAEEQLKQKGIRDVALWIRDGNEELQRYYAQLGYTPMKHSHQGMYKEL